MSPSSSQKSDNLFTVLIANQSCEFLVGADDLPANKFVNFGLRNLVSKFLLIRMPLENRLGDMGERSVTDVVEQSSQLQQTCL